MSILKKKENDPDYYVVARSLYKEECMVIARPKLHEKAQAVKLNGELKSSEIVKETISELEKEKPDVVATYKEKYQRDDESIDRVLGVLLWDVIDEDSKGWEWKKCRTGKIYTVKEP